MALSGCKTQGTQTEVNTATQESSASQKNQAAQLPMCTKWPSSELCLIPKESLINEPFERSLLD